MGGHIFPALHHVVSMALSVRIQMALAPPVVLWAGWPFFVRGWASVRTRNLNMFTLIAMGTGVALELQHGRRIQGIEERVRLLRVMNCQIYVTIGYSSSPSLLYYVS